jgi:amidase
MNGFPEYDQYDATGLGELVTKKEVAPKELVEAAIDRIERFNPPLNAVIHRMYDRALDEAERPPPEGAPFPGVPFLLKDLHAAYAGEPLTAGSRALRDYVPDHDAELVRRHRAAGLIIVGKTNTPEFGLAPVTEPELFGPTRNPWDTTRTPGGSSGGSAVAVAAGFVPMAHASDGGGSIRIPASACGLFGLKPTRARNPYGPDMAEGWFGMSEQHAVSRSVRDSALLLDATQGPDVGAPYVAPPPKRPFYEEVGTDPGRLRIAFSTSALLGSEVHRDCVTAVEEAARLCEELGHEVVEDAPQLDVEELTSAFVTLAVTGGAFEADEAARLTGRELETDDLELVDGVLVLVAKKTGADVLARALHMTKQVGRIMGRFMRSYDALLTSTLGEPPWPIGALDPSALEIRVLKAVRALPAKRLLDYLVEQLSGELLRPIPNTPLFNMTGQPAMTVPLHWNDEGLPVGVQFAGRFGDEATLFRLAAQLEQTRPWKERRPPTASDE